MPRRTTPTRTRPLAGTGWSPWLAIGAAALAGGAAMVALLRRGRAGNAEHPAPDLALDQPRPGADDRAPEAFRPDPTAPVPASEREGLRPATGPAPTLVANGPNDVDRITVAPS